LYPTLKAALFTFAGRARDIGIFGDGFFRRAGLLHKT
jgi:hypothetical protein